MTVPARVGFALVAVALASLAAGASATAPARPMLAGHTTTVKLGAAPLALTIVDRDLWVLAENGSGAVLLRLDRVTGVRRALVRVGAPGPDIGAVGYGMGRVWAAAGEHLLRVDPADPGAAARARLPGVASALTVGFGSVWVTTIGQARDLLVRLDPRSLAITARISVGTNGPSAVVSGLGSVWVAAGDTLLRVDPDADRVSAQFPAAPAPTDLALARAQLWTLGGDTVRALDRRDQIAAQFTLPVAGARFVIARNRIWVIDNCGCRRGTLVELDLGSKKAVAKLPTGETPVAITADRSEVWVANFGDGTLSRFPE